MRILPRIVQFMAHSDFGGVEGALRPARFLRSFSRTRGLLGDLYGPVSFSGGRQGFTLAEVLVALFVASIILGVAGSILTDFLVGSRKQEAAQSMREASSRANYLIQIEASEAKQISYSSPSVWPTGCGSQPASGDVLFTYQIPERYGEYGTDSNFLQVIYYRSGGDVLRCGPGNSRNGELMYGTFSGGSYTPPSYSSGVVIRAASIQVVTEADAACGSDVSSSRTVVFKTTFTRYPWMPVCGVARAKTVFVCNPPSAEMQALKTPGSATYDPTYDYPVGTCRP